ncbi:hypothetical protein DYB34_002877 [Aphanomyces astaci]|uniref:Serine hydrolase domain-containing protein n=1 Tax=Aphanomyces astaci TaxID=112090 RepID=A0A418BEK1_APHAT|nr:hypothetical protein DYB34_002877 [Aphanomyces astaci]
MEHLMHQVHTDMQSLHDRLDNVLANADDDVKAQAQSPTEDLLYMGSPPQQPALLPSWVEVQPPVEHVSVDEFQRQLDEFSNDQTNQLVEQLALHDAKWMGVLDQFEKKLLQSLAIETHEPLSPKSTVIGVNNQADIYETESDHSGAADEGKSVESDAWHDEDCPECNYNVDDEWQIHDFRTNATVMHHQVRGFRESFGDGAEFFYVNGPFPANGPMEDAIEAKFGSSAPFFEWFRGDPVEGDDITGTRYVGWEHSLAYLLRHLNTHKPYDIVLGFCQGGMMATLLAAHFQADHTPFPFKAVVCVGVVSPPLDGVAPSLNLGLSTTGKTPRGELKVPAMIVLGEADPFFRTGKYLVHVYDKATRRYFVHAEGHKFPSVKNHHALYDEIVTTFTGVISLQIAGLRQAFGPTKAEFVSVNAPFPASGPAQEDIRKFFGEKGPYYEWWDAVKNPDTQKTEYHGWEQSVAYVQRQIDELGPFDVVLGFSQGAALTTLLTAHYQKHQGYFPFKAVVLVCGLVPRDGLPDDTRPLLDIPSLHILGEQDPMLPLGHQLHDIFTPSHRTDFVVVDAPFPASGRPEQGIIDFFGEEGPYFEWWEAFERTKFNYPGWGESLAYLQNVVNTQGPFDIVLGFSQGASVATLLTAHYQAKNQKIPFKAVVLVCGLCPRDGMPQHLLVEPGTTKYDLKIPSIHILGAKDDIFDLSQDLVEAYSPLGRQVHVHSDGHRFPPPSTSRPLYNEIVDKLRSICAHGGRTNGTVVSLQVSGFVQAFGPAADFVELDAPFPASGPPEEDILNLFGDDEPYFEWWDANHHTNAVYPGWERSLEFLKREVTAQGPFDAIIGFSQGAMMATLLTAHYLQKHWVPFKAIILVCGMWPQDGMPAIKASPATGKPLLNFPSFHVLGEKDFMYEDGKAQVGYFSASSRHVYTHDQGHRFPPLPQSKDMYKDIADKVRRVVAAARATDV